jgi:hypothetical protein
MANDLVKRLRNVQFWQAECDMRMQAAARIEELEKLLKAAIDDAKEAEAYAAETEKGVS